MFTDLFGQVPEKAEVRRAPRHYRDFGKEPKQKSLKIKLLRKIALKQRYYEVEGVGNDDRFSLEQIMRFHVVLFLDWEDRFTVCEKHEDKLDFWLWMLGDPKEAFSFRDCLIAVGYKRVDDVIEEIGGNVPSWVSEIIDASPAQQNKLLLGISAKPGAFQHRLNKKLKKAIKASTKPATQAA